MERTIPIFRALIAYDVRDQYHANHGQLGYALKDQRKPDWEAAEQALSRAIGIRGNAKETDSHGYEFNRAVCRIMRDQPFHQEKPTSKEAKSLIVADLKTAIEDEWVLGWAKNEPVITKWLRINKLSLDHFK